MKTWCILEVVSCIVEASSRFVSRLSAMTVVDDTIAARVVHVRCKSRGGNLGDVTRLQYTLTSQKYTLSCCVLYEVQ